MRNKQAIKLFFVLLICTAVIFSSSHFGVLAYTAITSGSNGFATGTMIGSTDVSGKSKQEALGLLNNQVQKWLSETSVQLQYKEKSVSLDISQFQFDLENSVASAKDGQQNGIDVTYKSSVLSDVLKNMSKDLDPSKININPIHTQLISYATELSSGKYQLQVEKYLPSTSNKEDVVSETSITPDTFPIELGLLIEELSPIKVEAHSQISLLKLIEDRKLTTFSPEAFSLMATAIYDAILTSNFTIVERNIGQVLPDYVNLGYEAKVDLDNHLDLVFVNPNESSYEIELSRKDNTLSAYLKGNTFLYDYQIKKSDVQEFKPKTIIQFSPLLSANAVKVKQQGTNGQLVKVNREVYGENGEWLRKEVISEDYYPPIYRIEIHGLTSSKSTTGTDGQTNPSQGTADSGQTNTDNTTNTDGKTTQTTTSESDLYGKPNETTK